MGWEILNLGFSLNHLSALSINDFDAYIIRFKIPALVKLSLNKEFWINKINQTNKFKLEGLEVLNVKIMR